MKFVAIIAAILSLLTGAGVVQAANNTAVITVSGKVLANTCTISSGSANQTIELNPIADRDIKGKGVTGGEKDILITLTDCGSAVSNVVVSAWGNADNDDSNAFTNAISVNDGGSEGVGLYFYQSTGTAKFLPDGSVTETSTLQPSIDNTLTYKVAYVGTKDTVTAGSFSTVINMKFEYQ